MFRRASFALAGLGAVAVVACGASSDAVQGVIDAGSTSDDASTGVDSPSGDAGLADANLLDAIAADAPESADASCVLSQLPLLLDVDPDSGAPTSLHVQIVYQNRQAALLVDTGSGLTFLQEPLGSPDPVYDAGLVELGCLSADLIGRPETPQADDHGLKVVGTLGTDRLLQGPSEVDFVGQQILFHAAGDPFVDGGPWDTAAVDLAQGGVIAHVSLDGKPVLLEVDTGSFATLWVGQPGNPGDTPIQLEDAYGDVFTGYLGTGALTIGTTTRTVPVLRVPTFPSFYPLEPGMVGLVGLSSLGRAFVFDPEKKVLQVRE